MIHALLTTYLMGYVVTAFILYASCDDLIAIARFSEADDLDDVPDSLLAFVIVVVGATIWPLILPLIIRNGGDE